MSNGAGSLQVNDPRVGSAYPFLTMEQIRRAASYGRTRDIQRGEVLYQPGDHPTSSYVVISGELEAVRPWAGDETVVAVVTPGQFTGEVNTLSGRPAIVRLRVRAAGEVIELEHDRLLAMLQRNAELGEIFVRAYLLRRAQMVALSTGDVVLFGSKHSAATLRIKEFLTRNGHPYAYVDLERDPEAQHLLDSFQITVDDVPVVICRGATVLRTPTNREVADCLGFNESIDQEQLRDIVVIGAGPSGLAAAVYGASEGLDVLTLESNSPGGQAASSSRIENYLGFPSGISGQQLADRAFTQAEKFGAQMLLDQSIGLKSDQTPYLVACENGARIPTRTVVIATGAAYRQPTLEHLSRFEGAGVYYGATAVEAQICAGEDVIIVGGANSAGQAAVFLAQTAARVYMLVRSSRLAEGMSRYLIRRIEETPAIQLCFETELRALRGVHQLESVQWQNSHTGETAEREIHHVFLMTGASPNTQWLGNCVALDDKGFIKTGPDLSPEELVAAGWQLSRPPYLLETSLPGVFAVGDVRCGSVKRVASAVGEGSIVISFVHRSLQGS